MYIVVTSQTILYITLKKCYFLTFKNEDSSSYGMQTYIMSVRLKKEEKRSNVIFSFNTDNCFEIFHPDSLENCLQPLPITTDKYHLVLSDVLSEIKQ